MFKVPEQFRVVKYSDSSYGNNGVFMFPSCISGWYLFVIASDATEPEYTWDDKWEHVSIHARANGSHRKRTPYWNEMCQVKALFWSNNDWVVQFHPDDTNYINNHENVLHLWRIINKEFPTPPSILVGIK